jgi:apolipoprotein N-acyltransferase
MIKQTTILLLITILFTGCIERGQILKPVKNQTTPIRTITKKVKKQTSVSTKKVIKKKKTTITKEVVVQKELPKKDFSIKPHSVTSTSKTIMEPKTEKIETDFFSSISEETKNNISGFFVILIGIIILL